MRGLKNEEPYKRLISEGNRCSDAAPNCLDAKTDHIAPNEERGVSSRLQTANAFSVYHDNSSERQVDGGRDEYWTDRQSNQISEEVVSRKWISVEKNSSNVIEGFNQQANSHGDRHALCSVLEANVALCYREKTHDNEEERVAGEAGLIVDVAPFFNVARLQCADKAWDVFFCGCHLK